MFWFWSKFSTSGQSHCTYRIQKGVLMEKCSKISHLSKSDNHTQEIGDCVIRQFPLSSWRQQLTGATVKLHSRSTLRDQKRSRRQHSNYQQRYQLFRKYLSRVFHSWKLLAGAQNLKRPFQNPNWKIKHLIFILINIWVGNTGIKLSSCCLGGLTAKRRKNQFHFHKLTKSCSTFKFWSK